MGHLDEHLERGRKCKECLITNFEKIVRACLDGENKKSLQLFFVNINSCQLDKI